tara:strand:+ start:1693 stop:2238 length:546 start_codon:yes stop_codon:yes gene_type:complete
VIQEISNIKPFLDLCDKATKFMSPQRAWLYPRADSYLFYSLAQAPPYICSAPFWKELREDIFTELRTVLNKPTIYYLSLVVHNERSFHMPTGMSCPSNHLYLPLTKGGSVIKTENDRDLSFFSACKDIGMHAPELVPNWQERGKMWRKLEQYQAILVGNTSLITILPEPDTIYFHAEYRDD